MKGVRCSGEGWRQQKRRCVLWKLRRSVVHCWWERGHAVLLLGFCQQWALRRWWLCMVIFGGGAMICTFSSEIHQTKSILFFLLSYSDLLLLLIWFDVFCGDFDFFLCGDMFKSVFLFSRFCGLMFKLGFYFLGGTMVGYVKDEGWWRQIKEWRKGQNMKRTKVKKKKNLDCHFKR